MRPINLNIHPVFTNIARKEYNMLVLTMLKRTYSFL